MKPAVSVVTATRNYARFLAGAIRSVQAQTFTDWELVLIDDGSTDATPDVVRPFLVDPRVRYVRSDALGQTRAKNLSVVLARAPLLAFFDSDDVWLPRKLEKQYALFQSNPALAVVACRRSLIDEDGAPLPSRQPVLPRGAAFAQFVLENPVCFSSVMLRREVLEHVGRFDLRLELAIDYDLWLRISRHYAFDYVDEVLVQYRTGHANLSRRQRDRIRSVLSIIRCCLGRRGGQAQVSQGELSEAWGSTYRSMAYALRESAPGTALGWYARAAGRDGRLAASARSILATLARWFWQTGRRIAGRAPAVRR